ncbi:hypothetical protein FRB94_001512 [Tulasnella sp. JGI-2019a]|nr:hypothetical protein FRB94_001512 [Tulasnella sp. JGI-2019a]KAG9007018.1 hypothetical protein FRB93_008285 [Tulasnella sp. JGI-2019a]
MSTQAFGTNSPPLEATSHTNPIGKSDKDGKTAQGVPDANQRQSEELTVYPGSYPANMQSLGYFKDGEHVEERSTASGNNMNTAKQAAEDSVAKTDAKWDAEHNRAQQF